MGWGSYRGYRVYNRGVGLGILDVWGQWVLIVARHGRRWWRSVLADIRGGEGNTVTIVFRHLDVVRGLRKWGRCEVGKMSRDKKYLLLFSFFFSPDKQKRGAV